MASKATFIGCITRLNVPGECAWCEVKRLDLFYVQGPLGGDVAYCSRRHQWLMERGEEEEHEADNIDFTEADAELAQLRLKYPGPVVFVENLTWFTDEERQTVIAQLGDTAVTGEPLVCSKAVETQASWSVSTSRLPPHGGAVHQAIFSNAVWGENQFVPRDEMSNRSGIFNYYCDLIGAPHLPPSEFGHKIKYGILKKALEVSAEKGLVGLMALGKYVIGPGVKVGSAALGSVKSFVEFMKWAKEYGQRTEEEDKIFDQMEEMKKLELQEIMGITAPHVEGEGWQEFFSKVKPMQWLQEQISAGTIPFRADMSTVSLSRINWGITWCDMPVTSSGSLEYGVGTYLLGMRLVGHVYAGITGNIANISYSELPERHWPEGSKWDAYTRRILSLDERIWWKEQEDPESYSRSLQRVFDSHIGKYQHWHSMAQGRNIPVVDVQQKILNNLKKWFVKAFWPPWLEKLNLDSLRQVKNHKKRFRDIQSLKDAALHGKFAKRGPGYFADAFYIGHMLHTIMDSYAEGHTSRSTTPPFKIQDFEVWTVQCTALHKDWDTMDYYTGAFDKKKKAFMLVRVAEVIAHFNHGLAQLELDAGFQRDWEQLLLAATEERNTGGLYNMRYIVDPKHNPKAEENVRAALGRLKATVLSLVTKSFWPKLREEVLAGERGVFALASLGEDRELFTGNPNKKNTQNSDPEACKASKVRHGAQTDKNGNILPPFDPLGDRVDIMNAIEDIALKRKTPPKNWEYEDWVKYLTELGVPCEELPSNSDLPACSLIPTAAKKQEQIMAPIFAYKTVGDELKEAFHKAKQNHTPISTGPSAFRPPLKTKSRRPATQDPEELRRRMMEPSSKRSRPEAFASTDLADLADSLRHMKVTDQTDPIQVDQGAISCQNNSAVDNLLDEAVLALVRKLHKVGSGEEIRKEVEAKKKQIREKLGTKDMPIEV